MEEPNPLKAWRHSQTPPLTQEQAADGVDVDRVTWARWESKAGRKIDVELLPKVAAKTGIPAKVLRPDLAELLKDEVVQ